MLVNIDINKIGPHPDNPRKDLGDLTELADSIKANGILQNLTVVPWFSRITGVGADDPKQQEELGYIVVIGHRRFAAAKLAGLTEVPCVISGMNYKKQISTMLLENMQRNDLTIWEQAQGFQMMLDFGDTVEDISTQTGFSESTVRRRAKLLDLDKDKFQQAVTRGATLQDYVELDKIQDVEIKNSVLEKIGTSDFRWTLQRAIDKEKSEKNKAALITQLEKFAVQVKKADGLITTQYFHFQNRSEVIKPTDTGEQKYFFLVGEYSIQLLIEAKQGENTKAASSTNKEQRQLQEQRERLNEINKRASQLRDDFVRNYTSSKKHARDIMAFMVQAIMRGGLDYYGAGVSFFEMLGIEAPKDDGELTFDLISDIFDASPEKVLLVAAYCSTVDQHSKYHDWQGRYQENESLDLMYNYLERLGYEMSDEERALRNGTHELYVCDNKPRGDIT